LQTTRPDLASTLKEQAGGVLGSGAQVRLRKGLVVAQVALSLLLLTGAGLFLRSLGNLKGVDLGFRADHLMSFTIQPALSGYTPQRAIALFDALRQRAAGMPGVRSVAATQTPLLANENWDLGITVPGYEPKENENAPNVTAVSPGYFAALAMPLAAGREFREGDNAAAPRVAVVNQTFAQVYFGGQNPIGRQFYFTADAQRRPVEIVGVASDGKYADVREEKQRFVFCPYAQQYNSNIGGMTYYVRTSQDPESLAGALRQAVREADANLPVYNMKTMQRQIDEDVFAARMVSALSAFFGLLATVLAAIGLYGVMSYTVTRRTREIGIRMALGASRRDVLSIVLGEVALLAAIGIAIAAPLSFPLANLAKSMLYGVAPHDTAVLAGAAALLALTALAAGYIPAARAARVDPLTALRHD
jgi:predicted permease